MIWVGTIVAADTSVTIDGVNYILDTSAGTAKVTSSSDGYKGKALTIPSSITYSNRTYSVNEIGESAFSVSQYGDHKGVVSVSLPNTITKIGYWAFAFNHSITSITIPVNVEKIEEKAFYDCESLITIELSDRLKHIGTNAFVDCKSLISVNLPEGLTYIGATAFQNCSILSSITIPTTVTSIGNNAFDGCTNLRTIVWNAKHCVDFASGNVAPFSTEYQEYKGNGQGYSYYRKNEYTTSITFGDDVEYIPAYLCYNFMSLLTLDIPNSVKEIGESAFYSYFHAAYLYGEDVNLTSLSLGTGLEKIGAYAFYYRTKLSSITIPDKCTTISPYAFYACDNLSTITLGKGISTIGQYAFGARFNNNSGVQRYETNINTINIYSSTPPIITHNVFDHYDDLKSVTLNVRSKAVNTYKAADIWKEMYVQAMENDVRTFTLNVSSADESMGTTTPGGMYDEDSEVLVYAAAKDGYQFSRWNDGNTDNPRTVKMIGDLSYKAYFEATIPIYTYNITASANALEGTVVGGGIYEAGTQVTLAAIGNTGYHFTQWADGNTANPRQVTVTADASYTAQFAKDAAKYTLTTSSTNASQGTAYGQGKYEEGTNVAIFAVANDGYHFTQWHDGNVENPRMVTVSNDAMFFANFAQDPVAPTLYEVKIKPENTTQGWTTEGGSFGLGTQIMIYAHPTNGYEFSQWSDGNTENPRFLTITKAVELNAKFKVQSPNGIRSTSATTTGTPIRKVVRNGRVFIEYGDKTYTTQGVEIK